MKNRFLLFFYFVFFVSCSYDEKDNTIPGNIKNEFSIYVNGELMYENILSNAYIENNTIHLGNYLKFTTDGNLVQFNLDYDNRLFSSFGFNTSQYLNLNIISYDEVKKRIKAEFSGYIYNNPENINSEAKFVNGVINLPIQPLIAPVNDTKNSTKINNEKWNCINYTLQEYGLPYSFNTNFNCYGNDEYKIVISLNTANFSLGNYTFDENSFTNKVQIAKYNSTTNSIIYYNCSGDFSIDERIFGYIEGKYTFTAINPNNSLDILQISEGNYFIKLNPSF